MPPVQFDPATSTWLLCTPNTGYAVRWADGLLRHAYWGPALTLAQAAAVPLAGPLTMSSFEGRAYDIEELPVDGGARFGVPSLQVRFP
ncbi:MAG: alpha-galactosidase, partial [Micromonosporaceae bacterium]|nr:alpha-galactosidase [Micromonosporaceae bacterium]